MDGRSKRGTGEEGFGTGRATNLKTDQDGDRLTDNPFIHLMSGEQER